MKLTAHFNQKGKFSDIDKFILIPKKFWEYFAPGEGNYKLDELSVDLRVYDIPCDCSGEMHTHRLVDLRDVWDRLGLSDGQEIEIRR